MLRKLLLLFIVSCLHAYNVELNWSYVLSNPDFVSQEREAYFGFSVALITSVSSSWALVGAPRANDTQVPGSDVLERGAVYLCPLPASVASCRQLIVTDAANGAMGGGGNLEFRALQDHGWLGGALDLLPEDPDSVVVTCSPRWMNQLYSYDDYYVNGACYITSINNLIGSWSARRPWNIVTPLVDRQQQLTLDENGYWMYYYQLGQAGLSVQVSESGEQVWLGAPGLQQWTGSVAKVKENIAGAGDWVYMKNEVFKPAQTSRRYNFFGYSIGSGRFFGSGTHKVAGSPRHELQGKVTVFSTTSERIHVRWETTGPQTGSYFGAAVATGDVNADGWSELFVGAPLFSVGTTVETGLVIIYSRKTNLDDLEEAGRLIGSEQARARFGSSLMVVGDLDRDGYADLAVGAPYEADGAGAVYIYRGSANGLVTTYSQKLTARDVTPNLKGFGISISRGADVDHNGYADFAVGAHEGIGSAVVLRTRPVLKVHLRASSEYEILTETGMTFPVKICVSYNGFNILDETGIAFTGLVDDGNIAPRAVFVDSGTAQITFKATVRSGQDHCRSFRMKMHEKINDYARPLEVSFKGEVIYDDPGCEKCGLTSPASNLKSRISLPLALGCGADGTCTPQLELSVKWQGASQLALRSGSSVSLSIVVRVAGQDQSYVGVVRLLLPEGLTAHQPLPYSCSQTDRLVSCDLPNPMAVGEKTELQISVKESGDLLMEGEVPLKVVCSASGAQDVEKQIVLSLIEDIELQLNVHAANEGMIEYSPPPAPAAAAKLTYQILNRGDTRVNEVRLDTIIPTAYEDMNFAQITQQPTSSSSSSECSLEDWSPGTLPVVTSNPPFTVTAKLVCGERSGLACKRVICTVRQIHLAPIITVEVAYNITILSEKLSNNASVALYTSAAAAYGSPAPIDYTESGIWTTLAPKGWLPPAKSTPAWAYVVAVLVAVIILAVMVVVLVKIGFFKRKRPGENPDGVEGELEGQSEGEPEAAPLQSTGPDGEAAEMTKEEVEAEIVTYEDDD